MSNLRHLELYFGGSEVPTWRKLLIQEGVPHVGINFLHLKPRITKQPWLLSDYFPESQEIFLLSGSASTQKKFNSTKEHEEFLSSYLEFVQDNLDRIKFFTEYDAVGLGLDWVLRQREVWSGLADDKLVPVWHEEWGAPLLRDMVEGFANLGVPPISSRTQNVLSALVRRTRLNLHGLSFSHPYDAPGGLYSTIVSTSWISPMRFGETVVWDENRLRRYSADEKEKIRTRHRVHFDQAGFDGAAILADDSKAVARYTVWAWRQLEASMQPPERTRILHPEVSGPTNGHVDHEPDLVAEPAELVGHHPALVPSSGPLVPSGMTSMPVFDFRPITSTVANPDGPGTIQVTSQVAVMRASGLRQCDSCSLAAVCPLHEHGSECRYAIPIEIRNRDQLLGVLHSLLEMQGQRVAFGFFSEQLQGGYPDANLSSELDRFMRMTQSVKEIQDNRDFLKVTVEGRAQSGVLSRLFGAERAETLRKVDPDRAEDAVRHTIT